MGRVRVAGFAVSLDGFGAGPEQSLADPLGKRGTELHTWFFGTKTFKAMVGQGGGSQDVDETFARRSMDGFGAFILGRNMFGPARGKWPNDDWKGWWGDNREPIVMEGGTTFHFVTDGIHAALERARDAAGARDVKIGVGVATVRPFRAVARFARTGRSDVRKFRSSGARLSRCGIHGHRVRNARRARSRRNVHIYGLSSSRSSTKAQLPSSVRLPETTRQPSRPRAVSSALISGRVRFEP